MKKTLLILSGIVFFFQLNAQQSTTDKNRPHNVNKGIIGNFSKNQVIIDNIPTYIWEHGCGPTALGMLIGYYDFIGFPDLIEGDATIQNSFVDNAIANSEHYSDYSEPIDYYPDLLEDKSELGGAHVSNCIADFMQTSWSSVSNRYGWSWSSKIDDAFTSYIQMQNSDYYTYTSYEWFSSSSWDIFKSEIDNERPVILLVDSDGDGSTDHFVTGIGYDDATNMYAIYDTWDTDIHWYEWREMSDTYSWGIYGFNILNIAYTINADINPINSGTISGNGPYLIGETVNLIATANEEYNFVNWTENDIEVSNTAEYNFTASENRMLIANFTHISHISNSEINNKILIYPNPTHNYLLIEFMDESLNSGLSSIELIDNLGKVVLKQEIKLLNNKYFLNTSGVKPGQYFIKLNGANTHLKKIIIK